MSHYQNILAFVDDRPASAATLRHAAALVGPAPSASKVKLIDVIEGFEEAAAWSSASDRQALELSLRESRSQWLKMRAADFRGVDTSVLVRMGRSSVELIREAIRGEHDLVIKTARGKEEGRRMFFGSTATHLIRKCPAPVWLVNGAQAGIPRRIAAAVAPHADPSSTTALRVLAHARNLSEALAAELHVLHAWHPSAEHLLRGRVDAQTLIQYVTGKYHESKRALEALLALAELDLPRRQVHLVRGLVEETIPKVVDGEGIDVVVMGSVGRSGIHGLLIGEKAEEILGRVDCSVLCVKPEGFVSPIRPSE